VPLQELEELATFFEVDGGPAYRTLIVGPPVTPANERFAVTIAAIFRGESQGVVVYGDTDVEASSPSLKVMEVDLEGIEPGFTLRFLGLLEGEAGFGKAFKITPRITAEGINTSRIYLKEL
jgi:hypothetical protein